MDEYHKVGTTFRTTFDYESSTSYGTYVTGLAQGAFTITLSKNGTSGQSTTGITITELMAGTGTYEVSVSGTTGFPSATGVYELRVQRTANVADAWSFTVRVTSDGTGAGTWGDASFTATTNNGRVTDGSTALSGATVRILDPNGALYLQTTSSASGLWGPVYFSTAGTYTVSVQKSLYTIATGTITVAGSTATGPGADIALTAAGTGTGLTASGLWAYAKRCLRDRSGTAADLLAQQLVDDALSTISQDWDWPWYQTVANISLNALYSTGTIAVANGATTVTLTSGTWPSWAASAEIYIGGRLYTVSSRTSSTVIELSSAFAEATVTASTYIIAQTRYTLPTDLMGLERIVIRPSWPYGGQPVSFATLALMRSTWQVGQQYPSAWAITKNTLAVWPFPSVAAGITLIYLRRPALLTTGTDEADWDPLQLPVLRRAIEFQAALRGNCIVGDADLCGALYREALDRAKSNAKGPTNRPIADDLNFYDDQNARLWGVTET